MLEDTIALFEDEVEDDEYFDPTNPTHFDWENEDSNFLNDY